MAATKDDLKLWRKKNPNYQRKWIIKNKYGISVQSYKRMLAAQDRACAICRRPFATMKRRPAIDHCHSTGKIRGLLCMACNTTLGKYGDDPSKIRRLIEYLEKSFWTERSRRGVLARAKRKSEDIIEEFAAKYVSSVVGRPIGADECRQMVADRAIEQEMTRLRHTLN